MSEASADFVSTAGDTIVFTFIPQPNGFAFLSGAALTVEATGVHTTLNPANNQVSYSLPQGDSFIQVAIVDGPEPENGTLNFTINGGAPTDLWSDHLISHMPGAFFGFGE